jgi:hypothetical protein
MPGNQKQFQNYAHIIGEWLARLAVTLSFDPLCARLLTQRLTPPPPMGMLHQGSNPSGSVDRPNDFADAGVITMDSGRIFQPLLQENLRFLSREHRLCFTR